MGNSLGSLPDPGVYLEKHRRPYRCRSLELRPFSSGSGATVDDEDPAMAGILEIYYMTFVSEDIGEAYGITCSEGEESTDLVGHTGQTYATGN